MSRRPIGIVLSIVVCFVIALSCMDREPGPVCPVPTEIGDSQVPVNSWKGVDLLVVVDNSISMAQEQNILATGFFTLINSLTKPTKNGDFDPVENMRVAIVSSDMGLQYGNGKTDGIPSNICDAKGDDGKFKSDILATQITIANGVIPCEAGGEQCPAGFDCVNSFCETALNPPVVECPSPPLSGKNWCETSDKNPNSNMTTEVACLSVLGTDGCGVEQQLKAASRALGRDGQGIDAFIKDDHLLAVLVVSDEEDCSIKDSGMFETDQWKSGGGPKGHLNTSCNFPEENETDFLYDPTEFYNQFLQYKSNMAGAVIFAAIVGVPQDSVCQGKGNEIDKCLDADKMQLEEEYDKNALNPTYIFRPACERKDGATIVTSAGPGRRYVKLAQKFKSYGYVYSICNDEWSQAMKSIAEVIASAMGVQCYPSELEWERVDKEGCEECGEAKCDLLLAVDSKPNETEYPSCPGDLKLVSKETDVVNGHKIFRVYCKVPKIPTPKYCDKAKDYLSGLEDQPGWYYCENLNHESFEEACGNHFDEDGDGKVDCDDEDCKDCQVCNGDGGGTCAKTCTYALEMTGTGQQLATGHSVSIQCLQRSNFEDNNCKENMFDSCTNDIDEDGNGVWDCEKGSDHFPDPNCCPLEMLEDYRCRPADAYSKICPGVAVIDGNPDADTVCEAHARMIGCTLIE